MLNIKQIFSGGHHSWIVIDEENPEKKDFENPSPLSSPNFTPRVGRSVENSPRPNKQNVSIIGNTISKQPIKMPIPSLNNNFNVKFNLDLLSEKIEKLSMKNSLHVVYTDLNRCHRFVRFFVKKKKLVSQNELNSMIADYFKDDKSVILHRLQADDEINLNEDGNHNSRMDTIFREIKSDFKTLNFNSGVKKSFSLTIIYDNETNDNMSLIKKNIEELRLKNNVLNNHKNRSMCINILLNN